MHISSLNIKETPQKDNKKLVFLMDSGLYGVPQATPSPPPAKVSFSGIRAPLTIDSDVESEQSNGIKDTAFYYLNSESEEFLSGEDEFVIDSERPIVKYEDDDMEDFQESSDFGQYGDFITPLATQNDNFEESTNLAKYDVSKIYYPDHVGEIAEDNLGVEKNGSFSPVINAKIKYMVSPLEMEIEHASDDNVDNDVSFLPNPLGIIAQVSGDSDDDGSVHSEVLDDESLFSPVRIPEEILKRFNSIPKVRVVENEEEENTRSKYEALLELKTANGSIGAEVVKELSSTSEVKERSVTLGGLKSEEGVQDSVHDMSESVGQDYSQPCEQGTECEHSAVESNVKDDGYMFELDNETVEESQDERTSWMIDSHDDLTVRGSHSLEGSILDDGVPSTGCANSSDKLAHQYSLHSTEGHYLHSHVVEDEIDFNPKELVEDIEVFSNNDGKSIVRNSPDIVEEEMEQLSQRFIPDITPVDEIIEDYVGVDGQVTTDSDEEVEGHSDNQGVEIFDAAAFSALLKAASNSGTGDSISVIRSDGTTIYPLEPSVGIGSSFRQFGPKTDGALSEPSKKQLENLQQIRVKYLRLLQRLDRSAEAPIAVQVLYKLVLAIGQTPIHEFGYESAKRAAMELEADGKNDLNLSMNVLVIGKTGVGKSATINSIFAEKKATVNAFEPTTTHVKEIIGTVNGVDIRVLDTPGLRSSLAEQSLNRKRLLSIKKFIRKYPPDVVLYVDRLDSQARDLNDLPLLKSITKYLGSGIWHNVIVTLTHGASSPPDGPYGYPLSYETFIAQRSRVIQQLINYSVSDVSLLAPGLICPVSLVENSFLFQADGNGETLLPNGENWRSQLLLMCCSTKILSEVTFVLNAENTSEHKRIFGNRKRPPPLLYFLSSLLQPNAHPKLTIDGGVVNVDIDMELAYSSESDQDDEDEYDQLPPFKPLRKSQISELSMDQRKAYHEEYDYRVKLLRKKQLREEAKRIREMKKGKNEAGNYDHNVGESDQEIRNSTTIPLSDMSLPPSFDGNDPAYRYRFIEPSSQLLTRPVLDSHGWDHDFGYDGISIEDNQVIAGRFPAVFSVQLTKDKREFNVHLNSSVAVKHGDNGSTMAGLDIQTLGKQLAYILKSEYKLKNYKINKTAAGLSVTLLGENIVAGLKMEDQIALGKQLALAASTGATICQGDAAYGANMEVRLREKDYPVGQDQNTFGLSLMKWRGDMIWGCNLQSEFSVGRNYRMAIKGGLNNKMSGQISIRTISSDQLQIVMLALVPIAKTIFRNILCQS
ncbi:hypothetical protein Leryth_022620 [Lithospermum erythrorhizon]|nr:hypothetical protein Leryth_022620 [Lithospermum erythrorhizon]